MYPYLSRLRDTHTPSKTPDPLVDPKMQRQSLRAAVGKAWDQQNNTNLVRSDPIDVDNIADSASITLVRLLVQASGVVTMATPRRGHQRHGHRVRFCHVLLSNRKRKNLLALESPFVPYGPACEPPLSCHYRSRDKIRFVTVNIT